MEEIASAKAEVWLERTQHAQGEQIIPYGCKAKSVEEHRGRWGWKGRYGGACDSQLNAVLLHQER